MPKATAPKAKQAKARVEPVEPDGIEDLIDDDGVLDLDLYRARRERDYFPVRKGGRDFVLLPIDMIDADLAMQADSGRPEAVIEAMREAVIGDYSDHEAFAELRFGIAELDILFRGWLRKSGLDKGESGSSPDNSEPTAARSEQTSFVPVRR